MAVIVDYDAGNLRSVQRACAEVGIKATISNKPAILRNADRIIFPGVGAAGPAMRSIRETGIDVALKEAFNAGTPILGICLGLQISLEYSEENETSTLGFIPGQVVRFRMEDPAFKVPHMGWNEINCTQPHPLLAGIDQFQEYYFVHGFYPKLADDRYIFATATYEKTFCCAVGYKNYFGTQFHPEKSGQAGLDLLERFKDWGGVDVK